MASIYYYQEYSRMRFKNLQGMNVTIEFSFKVPYLPDPPTWIEMRCASEPLIMDMPNQTDGFAPITPLTMECRYFADAGVRLEDFMIEDPYTDADLPYWRAIVRMTDPNDNVVFERIMFVSEPDSTEELTEREHVISIKLFDGLASLKGKPFQDSLPAWQYCSEVERHITVLEAICSCLRKIRAPFSPSILHLVDNLNYDTFAPAINNTYVSVYSYANAEGTAQDCYSVLESILTDWRLELRPTTMGGWLLVRNSDYARMWQGAQIFKYAIQTAPISLLDSGIVDAYSVKHNTIVENGSIGIGGAGIATVVERYILRTFVKPLAKVVSTYQFRQNYTSFPNEFLKEGTFVSQTGTVKKYDISCWDSVSVNGANPLSVTITPIADIAYRYQEVTVENQPIFSRIEFDGTNDFAVDTFFKGLRSADIYATKNMALKIEFEHTRYTGVDGLQRLIAIRALTPGGNRWVQDDGSLGLNFNVLATKLADMSTPTGKFGFSAEAGEFYYKSNFEVGAFPDAYAIFTIFIIKSNPSMKFKDFRIEFEYYLDGASPLRLEGQEETVTTSIKSDAEKYQTLLSDSQFYDSAGTLYARDIGGVDWPTTALWKRYGHASDVSDPKSFMHQQALSILASNRRFLRKMELTIFGMYQQVLFNEPPTYANIFGFQNEDNLKENFRLVDFADHPASDEVRSFYVAGFTRYDVKGCKIDCILHEAYTGDELAEVNMNSLTYEHNYRLLFNGDRSPLDRTTLESKDKQIQEGRGWWWLYGPLGWLVWGRKKKIGG